MVAFPDRPDRPERSRRDPVVQALRELRASLEVVSLVLDAIREALLVPPVEVIRAERAALAAAEGTTCPPLPEEPGPAPRAGGAVSPRPIPTTRALLERVADSPDVLEERARLRRSAPHAAAMAGIREAGLRAAREGHGPEACPYRGPNGGYRRAWLEGHAGAAAKPSRPSQAAQAGGRS